VTAMDGPLVQVSGLKKSYGSIPALRGADLEVRAGERYGLIGPDGAGKTTLLRILCGLVVSDGGEVRVLGHDPVTETHKIKDGIGYMPQRFSLYPDLTVAENLRFFADLYRVPAAQRESRTARLLEFSRLGPFRDRRAGALSGGMKQKLALSCTLVHTPQLLILDEPTTGVDPVSRGEFWDILDELKAEEGVTQLVTTPYMDEASRCDRVQLMYQGSSLAEGSPAEVAASFPGRLVRVYTADPYAAAGSLKRTGKFQSVQLFGDRIHVVVEPAQAAVPGVMAIVAQIRQILEQAAIPFTDLHEARPDLEDIFVQRIGEITND